MYSNILSGDRGLISYASVEFQVIRSQRRTISIEIKDAETVVVRAPERLTDREIQRFLEERKEWLAKHLENARQRAAFPPLTEEELRTLVAQAKRVFPERTAHFAPLVGVTYGRITIRHQVSRWGSCSSQGNLNFNCLLMLCPREILDYVVVHELCHRKYMNHSSAFWKAVSEVLPDYQARRKWLKLHGGALIGRLPRNR